MLNLSKLSHKYHPSGVKMLAKYIKRGISVFMNGFYNLTWNPGNMRKLLNLFKSISKEVI
jgi:hypothetical protein